MYYIVILICIVLITLINSLFLTTFTGFIWYEILLWTVLCTIFVIIIDGLFAFIVRWLMPKKLYSVEKKHFIAPKKIRIFYEKLGVKRWKDKVLELGVFTGFSKNKIIDPKNNEYVKRFIIECNYGVGVHLLDMIMGFLVLFLCPKNIRFSVALPVSLVNLALNYLPYVILRYNLYKLHKLYDLNIKRQEKIVA